MIYPSHLKAFRVEKLKELHVKRITERIYDLYVENLNPPYEYYQDYNRIDRSRENFKPEEFKIDGKKYIQKELVEYWLDPRGYIAGYKLTPWKGDIEVVSFLHIEDFAGNLVARLMLNKNVTEVTLYVKGVKNHEIRYEDGEFAGSYSSLGLDEDDEFYQEEECQSVNDYCGYTFHENGLLKTIGIYLDEDEQVYDRIAKLSYDFF